MRDGELVHAEHEGHVGEAAVASILAMPYAILASSLPQAKLGIYMGLFNVFVVVPQLLVATVMGSIMKAWFPGDPIWTLAFAAGLPALVLFRGELRRDEGPDLAATDELPLPTSVQK